MRGAWTVVRTGRRVLDSAVARRYSLPPEASGIIWLDALGYAGESRNSYAPTPWRLIGRMLPVEDVNRADVFVDFGCGMGRVLLEAASRYPFARVIGVELVPSLADAATAALSANQRRLRCAEWEIVNVDVLDYPVPDDLTVAYFYDPFTGSVFDAVIARLEESVERNPRRLRLVYLTPREMPRLLRSPGAVPVRRGTAGAVRAGARYDYFVCDLVPATPTSSR